MKKPCLSKECDSAVVWSSCLFWWFHATTTTTTTTTIHRPKNCQYFPRRKHSRLWTALLLLSLCAFHDMATATTNATTNAHTAFASFQRRSRPRGDGGRISTAPNRDSVGQGQLSHDLHFNNLHEYHKRLLLQHKKNKKNNDENDNITSTTTATTDASRLPNWRSFRLFQSTRHFSRYEIAYRQQAGLDLHVGWNGSYHETNIINNVSSTSFLSTWTFWRRSNRPKHASHVDEDLDEEDDESIHSPQNDVQNRKKRPPRRKLMNVTNWITNAGHVDNYQSVPLSQGYGTHLANVWVGSPHPQRKTVIVDTGSHFTAFPCKGCQSCGGHYHTDPYFDPAKSESFHQLQCDECVGVMCDDGRCIFSQSYTEGSSWDAIQVKDQFYCGGLDVLDAVEPTDRNYAIDFMFGCMTKVNGLFLTQLADGIMGMSAHEATITKQLWNKGVLEHNMFALCFRRELGTSKRGVPAGSMTLGGVSTNLDSSPIVYAKNMAKSGWFTVYVKNIFVRAGGGQSASPTPGTRTVRVHVDLAALNSGKGVIVDSGTTDTYLNSAVAPAFRRAWKMATGRPYSHFPMRLTDEELSRLPTILVQCHAYATIDPAVEDYDSIPGYVGSLDPTSPNDLLIAIPATSYMDFSPITKMYTSRLYLTETSGGVLGSNTMQGHNVVFDWRLGRIGFAESSCTYDKRDLPGDVSDEEGYPADCVVNKPILTTPCLDTVEQSVCEVHPTNIALLGKERWTALVESPGTAAGLTCQQVAAGGGRGEKAGAAAGAAAEIDSRRVECRGDGVCEEERDCQLTCTEMERAKEVHAVPGDNDKLGCGDSYWSACDTSCRQTRLYSMAYSDGRCHEVSRKTRVCHTGACMRESPCLVPYLVHVVLGFHGLAIRDWTYSADDIVSEALVRISSKLLGESAFAEGDVNVVFSLPWYLDEDNPEAALHHKSDEEVKPVGVKVVLDVSIVNRAYNKTSFALMEDEPSGTFENLFPNWTVHNGQIIRCNSEDLNSLAKLVLRLKKEVLSHPDFVALLTREMKRIESEQNRKHSYFDPVYARNSNTTTSRLIAMWSIPTGVDEEINYYGPHRPFWYIFLRILHITTIILMVLMLIWSLGGASLSLRDVCLRRHGWRCRRKQRYSVLNNTTDSDYESNDDNTGGGGVTLELAVHSPDRYRNGPVVKRKGSQQMRLAANNSTN